MSNVIQKAIDAGLLALTILLVVAIIAGVTPRPVSAGNLSCPVFGERPEWVALQDMVRNLR